MELFMNNENDAENESVTRKEPNNLGRCTNTSEIGLVAGRSKIVAYKRKNA
jgi:hypothetical protein